MHLPDSLRIEWATKSACLSVLRTPVVRKVGVMSVGGSFIWDPNTYTTLEKRREAWMNLSVLPSCPLRVDEWNHLPIDVMAHARDESGQEHERFPVWRFFTCDTAHITVGPAITLRQEMFLFLPSSQKSTSHTCYKVWKAFCSNLFLCVKTKSF